MNKEKHVIEIVQVSDQLIMIKWSDNTIDFHRLEKGETYEDYCRRT